MRTSARARLAKIAPVAMPLTTSWRNSCICLVPQVRAAHRLVALQLGAGAVDGDAPHLEDVSRGRQVERDARVLLHEQDGDLARLVDAANDLEDRAHYYRREPERRLVEQHQARPHEQRTREGEHLLLATGQRAGREPPALLHHGEVLEDPGVILFHLGFVLAEVRAKAEVLVDR